MNAPQVSVIVPSYNKAEYLPECLRSVQAQTFTDWECIVVNDGSPRGEEIRAAVETMNDSRFRLVEHESNRGLSAARNTGVRLASGKYVICVDEDDWLAENCIERLVVHLESTGGEIVCPEGFRVGVERRPYRCKVLEIPEILVGQRYTGAGFLMRKDVWGRVGGWDEHPILQKGREDKEWWIRVTSLGVRIEVLEEPLYFARTPTGSEAKGNSLSYSIQQKEVQHRRYIIDKHRHLYDQYPKARRHFLSSAYRLEAQWCFENGRKWRGVILFWQAALLSRRLRDGVYALKALSALLVGEKAVERCIYGMRHVLKVRNH